MNVYAIIIFVTLISSYLLSLITNLLNLKHLSPELPGEFEGTYDAEAYKNSQDYTRVYTRFGVLTGTISIAITLIVWFAGVFNFLDTIFKNTGLVASFI